jgi:nucleotide-binding universal stress UspA family protein
MNNFTRVVTVVTFVTVVPLALANTHGKGEMNTMNSLNFKTIAVATDLSDTACSALRYAQAMARMYESTLVLVHVIDPLAYAFPNGAPALLAANDLASAELKRVEEETIALGIPVHSVIESGIVCERILQAVSDHHAELLVLGTRAKTEAGRVALGTVARQLLAKSRCPILTIPPDAVHSLPWAGCWLRVLAATDFSPASIRALRCAHQVALRQLILVHVSECQPGHECTHCQERLRFLAPFNESHTVPVEHVVLAGEPAELIARYAQKFETDLVVLGSPENELTEEDLNTSTVLQVISKVKCPVLCLPFIEQSTPAKLNYELAAMSGLSA